MTTELQDRIWIEKYRPNSLEELIFDDKQLLVKYMENAKGIPSFIFYSSKPGTGKTSTALLIAKYLECDFRKINSSDERGIDTIREQIKLFARSLSSNENTKRCVFLDEADGLTRQAQDSLRNLMEEYSDNCFFIFTANDLSKIIEPIRSRCQVIDFEKPNKAEIEARLGDIVAKEELVIATEDLERLIEYYYPDIRKMINKLQELKISGKSFQTELNEFQTFYDLLKKKDVSAVYDIAYRSDFDKMAFNRWLFSRIFEKYNNAEFEKIRLIALRLADNERSWNLGANLEVIFISNMLEIIKVL